MSQNETCGIDVELDVLRSIFNDELVEERAGKSLKLIFKIKPDLTSCDDTDSSLTLAKRCCALQLEIHVPEKYPDEKPKIELKNPRGLADFKLVQLSTELDSFLAESQGPILYDIMQLAQDFLNRKDVSVPDLPCSICLDDFLSDSDVFVTDQCHHHFHIWCLGRYLEHVFRERLTETEGECEKNSFENDSNTVPCPICRHSVQVKQSSAESLISSALQYYSESGEIKWKNLVLKTTPFVDQYRKNYDNKFRQIYEKQKKQGGLIDMDEEKRRMLITDETKIHLSDQSTHPSTSGLQNIRKKDHFDTTSKFDRDQKRSHHAYYQKRQFHQNNPTERVVKKETATTINNNKNEEFMPKKHLPMKDINLRKKWPQKCDNSNRLKSATTSSDNNCIAAPNVLAPKSPKIDDSSDL